MTDTDSQSGTKVYRLPVTLYDDETTGDKFFYLQKYTFPGRIITNLNVHYTDTEKSQVHEQVLANQSCPEIILHAVQVECSFGDESVPKDENDDPTLTDDSFRLSGSKIGAIRMRMYAKNKLEAQKQLEDPSCTMIRLNLDIECRLVSR